MSLKIRCDGKSGKFCKIFLESLSLVGTRLTFLSSIKDRSSRVHTGGAGGGGSVWGALTRGSDSEASADALSSNLRRSTGCGAGKRMWRRIRTPRGGGRRRSARRRIHAAQAQFTFPIAASSRKGLEDDRTNPFRRSWVALGRRDLALVGARVAAAAAA